MPDRALVNPIERLLTMRASALFRDLPSRELEMLGQYAQEVVYQRGDVIQPEDRPPAAVHLIVDGKAEVRRAGYRPMRLSAPDRIGALELFARSDGGTRVTALTEVVTLRFPSDLVLEVIEDQFVVLHALLKGSAEKLIGLYSRLMSSRDLPDSSERAPCRCAGREMNLVERLVYLRRMPLFAESSLDAVTELARALVEVHVPAGEVLWRVGDEARSLCCVVRGSALATIPGNPATIRYRDYALLGGICSLAEAPRYHDAVAETPLVLLELEVSRLLDVIEDNHEMGLAILGGLAKELLDVQRRLEEQGAREVDWEWPEQAADA